MSAWPAGTKGMRMSSHRAFNMAALWLHTSLPDDAQAVTP